MLCGSSLWKSLKPWVSQQFAGFREAAMRQQFPMQTKQSETQYALLPDDWLMRDRNRLAYTGSSTRRFDFLMAPPHRSGNRRKRSAAKTRRRSRIDLFGKGAENKRGRPRARRIARPHCISLRARALATVRRKEHRARRRGIHLSTV